MSISSKINEINNIICENFPDKVVKIIAVSKKQSHENIKEAYYKGLKNFGENYLQEYIEKKSFLCDLDITWHYIGKCQSNKAKMIASEFDWIQSIDNLKFAKKINKYRNNMPPINVLINVNIDSEHDKNGINIDDLFVFTKNLYDLKNIKIRGIMCIPKKGINPDRSFRKMYIIFKELQSEYESIDSLSMGMSGDFELAIQHGANVIRIGQAIFGKRI